MTMQRMIDVPLRGKRVLIREDLNVPLDEHGRITSPKRLSAALPTILKAKSAGAKVMLLSHLGRPTEGQLSPADSLLPVTKWLERQLHLPVRLVRDYLDGVDLDDGEVVVLENCRINPGETSDNEDLARRYAALCDIFVMDAFATAHRKHASTHGVIRFAKTALAGPLLCAELDALDNALKQPKRPLLSIIGGSKVSTKLDLLGNLLGKTDQLIVGGGIANTFLAARGYCVGKSILERDLIETAKKILAHAQAQHVTIPLPVDVTVAPYFHTDAPATIRPVHEVSTDDMILDIGPQTAMHYCDLVANAKTVLWNGPPGVFEFDAFAYGTEALARAIAQSPACSIAGGGDTLAAIDKYGIADDVTYTSTGGGAFLAFLEGRELPAVAALKAQYP